MIRYLENKAIDKKQWDQLIQTASNGMVYAMSWYLDIVSPGWDAMVENDYESVFPLPHSKKYGINYLRQPHFTQQLGIFSSRPVSESLVQKHLNAIPEKFRFIEINLNTNNYSSSGDFKNEKRLTHLLDLNSSYETLYKAYSENLKRNISKAVKSELSLDFNGDENRIVSMFRQNRGKDIAALKSKDYQTLLILMKEGRRRGIVQVIVAKTIKGNLCAGAIFIYSHGQIIFLFSATSSEAKKNGAMSMIIDHVIKSNAGKAMILDFEGSMDPNLARFYKGFASKEAVYLRIRRNNLPKFVRWVKS